MPANQHELERRCYEQENKLFEPSKTPEARRPHHSRRFCILEREAITRINTLARASKARAENTAIVTNQNKEVSQMHPRAEGCFTINFHLVVFLPCCTVKFISNLARVPIAREKNRLFANEKYHKLTKVKTHQLERLILSE